MANTKEIQDRIKSINDTLKITNAMYMISSSKLKKSKKMLSDTEPYFFTLQSEMSRILRHLPDMNSIYFKTNAEIPERKRKAGYIVITADKGLAGSYNHNILKIAEEELAKREAALGNDVIVYNRKGHHVSGSKFDVDNNSSHLKNVKIKTVFTFQNSKLNAIVYSLLSAIRVSFSRCDVVHIHAEGPASMSFLPKLFGKRVVVTIHGLDWQRAKWGGFATRFLKYGERNAAKYADEIIVLSKNVQNYFKEKYGRDTVFIPNGVEKPVIKNDNEINKKYGLKKNDYILFLGRIVPEKQVKLLIEAYKNLETDKKLVIAGGASHTSDYFNEVKECANGRDDIIFTDFVQGEVLEELYSNAYIYVLPSDLEGMPLSLLEAMSYSNCCLTSDIAECTEVCEENAVYFKKSDKEDLENKLRFLLENENIVEEYKEKAQDYICRKYNWDDITEKTLSLYKK